MTSGMKIISKLTVEVKEIEEHVSYEGKRQKTARGNKKHDERETTRHLEENAYFSK